jgi:3-hydroxyacyl-CoA dehydrogenase
VRVERVAVVGAGVMGSEIAQVAAAAGLEVLLSDVRRDLVERGLAHVRSIGERRVARGRLDAAEAEAILARVTPTEGDDGLDACDAVIEAVTEVIDVKRQVFRRLDALLPPGALLASNTSGLSISALARETHRADRVVGLHFFNPASVMPLVEVIQGESTSETTLADARDLAERIGKIPVLVRECPGFLVNRMLVRAAAEAYRRAEEIGADPASADAAVVAEGPAPMGPFALGDLVGLDTLAHVASDLQHAYGDRFADGGQLARQVAAGRLGQKSGAGFYEGRPPEAAPDAPGSDVAERYYAGALDEACRCLEEEIAALEDIDLAMRLGAGWARGPLRFADDRGLDAVAERLEALAAAAGPRFAPRAPLAGRAARGGRFTVPS